MFLMFDDAVANLSTLNMTFGLCDRFSQIYIQDFLKERLNVIKRVKTEIVLV